MSRSLPARVGSVLLLGSAALALDAPAVAAQSDIAFPKEVYAERRARLVEQLQAPIVVPSEYMIRAGGEKRQEPNFFYLTGVESPYAILVIAPDGSGGVREQLFLPAHREFAGAQYSFQDPRLLGAAWNRLIRRLEPGAAAQVSTGIAEEVGTLKRKTGTLPLDPRREAEIVRRVCDVARVEGIPEEGVRQLFWAVIDYCREGVLRRHASRDERTGAPSGSAGTPLG